MRVLFNRSLRLAWYSTAALVVTAALASIALRLALPGLDAQRPAIERIVSRLTGAPVHLARIDASWRGAFPSLTVDGILVGDASDALHFEHAAVDIALLATLRQRDIVLERLELAGIRLKVRREADGRFVIAGIPPRRSTFIDWALRQRDIVINDADVEFEDVLRGTPPRRFKDVHLALRGGREVIVRGGIEGDSILGAAPRFELHVARDAGAELRVAVQGVEPAPLLEFAGRPTDNAANIATLDGELWLRWQDDAVRRVAFDLKANLGAAARPGGFGPKTLRTAGVATRAEDAWRLRLTRLVAGPSAGPTPATSALLTLRTDRDGLALDLMADKLSLDLAEALSAALPTLPHTLFRGELRAVRGALRQRAGAAPAFYLAGHMLHGYLGRLPPAPGVDRLDAAFAVNADAGALAFDGGGFILESGEHLVEPVPLSRMSGAVTWRRLDDGWRFATAGLDGLAANIPFAVSGNIDVANERRPRIDAELELGAANLARLHLLLPKGALKERAETWSRRAFRSGRLEHLHAELRGDLARFPFDAGDGVFSVEFNVADTELEYSGKWPAVSNVTGHGAIAGRHFAVTIPEAGFFASPGRDIRLSIADLFNPRAVLLGTGTVRASHEDVMAMIEQSPLRDGPLRRLGEFALDGSFDLALKLDIGLRRGDRKTATGTVRFGGNNFRAGEQIELRNLRGELAFTRETLRGVDLAAVFDGEPVTLDIEGRGPATAPGAGTEVRMRGRSGSAQLLGQLERYTPFLHAWLVRNGKLDAVRGEAAWHASLILPSTPPESTPPLRRLQIESNLAGLAIDLPWPVGKGAAERRQLRVDAQFGGTGERSIRAALDDTARVRVDRERLEDGTSRLLRTDLAFGPDEAEATAPGIHLHGTLDLLPLAEWARLLANAAPRGSPTAALPVSFDARVKQFQIIGQTFADIRFKGEKDVSAWRVTADSARVKGEITVPFDQASAPLTLNLDRLWLEKVDSSVKRALVDPRRIPTVALACASFRYGKIDFGSASMATEREADGQRLKSLVFTNPAFQIGATGDWWLRNGAHSSHFSIDLKGKSLRDVLTAFAYDAKNIEGGRTDLKIEADWQGMPSEFTLDRLDGSLVLKIGKGRFLDIEPGGGRLFGLLSLQTLPRRLSLDFSDIFQKGFAFDRIEGAFQLENGDAYTNSLLMEGPSAKVEISGRTGLAAKDYDQRAIVTPALSDSIPLASALFGPAGIGVGAAIYLGQKVFKQVPAQVDRFLRREYTIKGPWSAPVIEKR
jgi:uncharacterized protein (TIGR02099 family)